MVDAAIKFRKKKPAWVSVIISVLITAAFVIAILEYSVIQNHVYAETFVANVVKVRDGDTIDVWLEGETLIIRLYGIDAPEWRQPYSRAATRYLKQILCNPVTIEAKTTDQYGRMVAVLSCNGIDINAQMVEGGYAWAYKHYSNDYVPEENAARQAGKGLWQETDPEAPWHYRHKRD